MPPPRGAKAPPYARKRFGQHFLHSEPALDAIVDALGPLDGRTVVEIGPGRGVLTERLAARASRVLAIEIDRDLVTVLRARFATQPHVEIVEADVLQIPIGGLTADPYVLVGNVPYYITTPILFHALVAPRPDAAVYLVQREVAERMVAEPGSKTYGALSVNLQALSDVEMLAEVPPGAFSPPPTVHSAIVRVTPKPMRLVDADMERRFQGVVIAAFGVRRKQMLRVVRTIASVSAEVAAAVLDDAGIDHMVRPETLSPGEFARLVSALDRRSV